MFHGQIHSLDFGIYRTSLFLYMIKFVYQLCVKSLSVINYNDDDKCKYHESHITFGIEPKGKHKSGSIQVYKLTDRQQHIDQPSLPQSK